MKIRIQQYRNKGDEVAVYLPNIKNINGEQLQRLIEESVLSIDADGKVHLHIGYHVIEVEYEQEGEFNFKPKHVHFLTSDIKDINLMDFFLNGKPLNISMYATGGK